MLGLADGLDVEDGEGEKGDEASVASVWTAVMIASWTKGGEGEGQQVWCGGQEFWFGHVKLEKLRVSFQGDRVAL